MELFDKDAKPIVQSPPPGKFSSLNVQWQYLRLSNSPYPVQQVCHIPYDRVPDFIRGEAENPEHPTTFRIYSSRRRRRHSKTTATTFRTYSEELTYWCVYGPDTKPRKHKKAVSSTDTKRTRPRVTPSRFQKGCGCHFIVHRLVLLPDAARISYVHPHHTNDDDLVCHAVDLDRLKLGLGIVAPWLSYEIKRWVVAFLCAGFTWQQVFDRHVRALHERRQRNLSYQISRDDFLTPKDVSNIDKQLGHIRQEVDNEDALSVRLWCLLNKGDVFIYQEQNLADNAHFILGLQTEWQLELMLKFGHDRLIAINSTLGANRYKFYLHSIMVFDNHHQSAIPVAWIITSSCCCPTVKQWLQELCNRAISVNAEWKPNAFAIDDAAVDVEAFRSVFNIPILLCLWHVRRCWVKHLFRKVKRWCIRAQMFNALGRIMDIPSRPGQGSVQRLRPVDLVVNEFMTQYSDQEEFIAYFREHWQKKIDTWVWAARTLSHANQEANASMEAFHCILKQRFLKGKQNLQCLPADWLFHVLTTEVAPYFWYQQHAKEGDGKSLAAMPPIVESSVARALKIPDTDVEYPRNAHFPTLGHVAQVRSQSKREVWHEVFNAQSGWACCTCDWAVKGNICKHQFKVMLMEGVPVSSMTPSSMGFADDSFPTHETLQLEPTILEQEAYHEPHLSNLLLRESVHPPPCNGLEEDIQRLQQHTLQLAGGNFSLLQLLREDMRRAEQILLEARSGTLDVIPPAGFRTQ